MKPTPKMLWLAGLSLVAVGQSIAAFDPQQGNTISEHFDGLPLPAKFAIVCGIGAVLGHWVWPMPTRKCDIKS